MLDHNKYLEQLEKVFSRYYPLNENSVLLLQSLARIEQIKKGEFLLPVNSIAKNVHILCKGAIIAYFIDDEGNRYNKNIFLEGDFVGSTVSYLTNTPSSFALESIEDSVIISFNYSEYRKLIEANEDLKNFYIAYLEKNWVIDKEKREIAIVMKNASQRYLELIQKHPNIDRRIPLQHIASHLGITPTQLSRIRKNFLKKSSQSTYVKE